uniref:CUE domain-containing protein n=2 Tax=Kalanchoe fedtschenkoi TaxID=63787 RepID=A0A7N0VJM1_KALFE
MSLGSSKLNPYAAAYVPIAKRMNDASKVAPAHSDSGKELHSEERAHMLYGFLDSSSQEYSQVAGSRGDDGQLEMDLAYLQTLFPSVSEESLIDVYSVNGCDLDAAYDMLSQLESLPDSLDIGDISGNQNLPELANLKLKEVAGAGHFSGHAQPQN